MMVAKNKYLISYENLMKEWDWKENNKLGLDPNKLTYGSNKKAWWKCKKCLNIWKTCIKVRTTLKSGCPYCVGQKATKLTCLSAKFPEIAKEWDYNKNENMSPHNVTSKSNRIAWWKCNKCNSSWKTNIVSRTNLKSGCPYCVNQKANNNNCLSTLFPNILIEWDYNRNAIFPNDIVPKSHKKVWWKCSKGHKWKTSPYKRVIGQNCPKCSKKVSNTSQKWLDKMEKVYGKIEREYPIKTKISVYTVDGFSIKHNIVFSYHGNYYHGNPTIYDLNDYNDKVKKTFGELYLNTIIRSQYLKAEGYCVIEKWGN